MTKQVLELLNSNILPLEEEPQEMKDCVHKMDPDSCYVIESIRLQCRFKKFPSQQVEVDGFVCEVVTACKTCNHAKWETEGFNLPVYLPSERVYKFIYKFLDPLIIHQPKIIDERPYNLMMSSLGIPPMFTRRVKQCIFEEIIFCCLELPTEVLLIVYKHMVIIKVVNDGIEKGIKAYEDRKQEELQWEERKKIMLV